MPEPGTAELLKEILLELRALNRNLGMEYGGRSIDGKNAGLEDTDAISQLAANFEAGLRGGVQSDVEDRQAAKGVGTVEAPKALVDGAFDNAEPSKLEGDHLLVDSAKGGKDLPVTEPSHALVAVSSNDRVSSEPDAKDDRLNPEKRDVTFCYHWNLPSYGHAREESYPKPSEVKKALWSKYLGTDWAIPGDGRLPLTLNSPYLMSKSDEEAEGTLRAVRDYTGALAFFKTPGFSRFIIMDYLPHPRRSHKRSFQYFSGDPDKDEDGLPEHFIKIKWNVVQYPLLPLGKPWRRFM